MKYILLALAIILLICIIDYFRYANKRKKVEESFLSIPAQCGDVEPINLSSKDTLTVRWLLTMGISFGGEKRGF